MLFWPEGADGIRNFTLVLLAIQQNGLLTARLALPSGGAVLHPSATAVKALVQSPVVAFDTNLVRLLLTVYFFNSLASVQPDQSCLQRDVDVLW